MLGSCFLLNVWQRHITSGVIANFLNIPVHKVLTMAKEQNFLFIDAGLKFSRFVKNKRGIVLYNKENLIRCIFENANGILNHNL